MKKKMIAILAVLGLTIAVSASSCDDGKSQSSARQEGQKLTEQAYEQQSKAVPYPADQLKDSLERQNLRDRLLLQNKKNQIGYVYILSFGKFIGFYTIKGKVSSTQSQMTPSDTISGDLCGSGCSEHTISEAPGDDGSYGKNEDGIFFFTTDGAMIQVSTDYIYSTQPVAVGGIPELNK